MEQITLTNKEQNKIYINRYKEKDPVKYDKIIKQAKRKYYQKNKEKLTQASQLYRKTKKAQFDFYQTFYDDSKSQENPEQITNNK
jgi:hypothetical protein